MKHDRKETVWLVEGSPAHVALEGTIKSTDLLNDLVYLTNFCHTGGIEVYNSLYNKFCPKRSYFSWYGMIARTQLAVLDFNSTSQCIQTTTQENKNHFKLSFSKVTQNWVVKKISSKKNKKYIEELMDETIKMKSDNQNYELMPLPLNVPEYLVSKAKPDKNECIKNPALTPLTVSYLLHFIFNTFLIIIAATAVSIFDACFWFKLKRLQRI